MKHIIIVIALTVSMLLSVPMSAISDTKEQSLTTTTQESFDFTTSKLDMSLFTECDEPGEVIKIEYDTFNYAKNVDSKKSMVVYLPFDYNEEKQYNVIIALPSMMMDDQFILCADHEYYDGNKVSTKNFLDNIIQQGICEPFILVCINCYYDMEQPQEDVANNTKQVGNELRDVIIPYIKENYSVYDSKDHYGFIGFSYGASLVYLAGLGMVPDLIGNFGSFSGYMGYDNAALENEDINYLYVSCGGSDVAKDAAERGYKDILTTGKIDENNSAMVYVYDSGHGYQNFINGLYDCARLFFN